MYYSYYRLSKNPFGGPSDPRQICMTETHREALSTLVYGILERKPFVAVIGEVGVGKTTVLQAAMLAVADQHARIIQIHQPVVPPDALIRAISEKLTAPPNPPLTGADLERLDQLLVEEAEVSGRVVIVIDEAQGLPQASLEHLRLLSNLRAGQNGLLEIIFVGQPEFWTALQRDDLRHLRQRISVRSVIRPLSEADARSYVEYKLRLAGSTTAEIMTDGALQAVLRFGRGVPRRINMITDNSLVTGFGLSTRPITAQIVKEAAASIDAPLPGQDTLRSRLPVIDLTSLQSKLFSAMPKQMTAMPQGSVRLIAAAVGGAAIMAVIVWMVSGGSDTPIPQVAAVQQPSPPASPPPAEAVVPVAAPAPAPVAVPVAAPAPPPRPFSAKPVTVAAIDPPPVVKGASVAAPTPAKSSPPPKMVAPVRTAEPAPAPVAQPAAELVPASEAHQVPLIRLPGIHQIEYKTERGDKADGLMTRFYGRSDEDAMNLFMMLNPLITDPDHLAPGTWIHLPSNKSDSSKTLAGSVAGLFGWGGRDSSSN